MSRLLEGNGVTLSTLGVDGVAVSDALTDDEGSKTSGIAGLDAPMVVEDARRASRLRTAALMDAC